MKPMKTCIMGKVNNFNLPYNQALMPILEALVNSIQAINDRKKTKEVFDGRIDIRIQRKLSNEGILGGLESVEIRDNGIGLDSPNFGSFMQADSIYKLMIGGKGVGRFSWLKAFPKVEIKSNFKENGEYYYREFVFYPSMTEIDDAVVASQEETRYTSITLLNMYPNYQKHLPIDLYSICMKLVYHCMIYLYDSNCPSIYVCDEQQEICLNKLFRENMEYLGKEESFVVSDEVFNIKHFKIKNAIMDTHKFFLCATNRLVEMRELDKFIVDLSAPLDANKSYYLGIITSKYLDENVDVNRLSFTIEEDADPAFKVITKKSIIKSGAKLVENLLQDTIKPLKTKKLDRINQYITNIAPQYRTVWKYKQDKLAEIKITNKDESLEYALYQLNRELDLENKKTGKEIEQLLKSQTISSEEYQTVFQDHIERITDSSRSLLVNYIAHRKSIIDLFEYGIRKNDDDKYRKEAYLHNIIYPMRTTSEDVNYEDHNLWLIDEKLSYQFAISDIPFNNDPKEKRPDLILLDKPIAMAESENNGMAFDNIVIYEFKRPMRDDLSKYDPVDQILDYKEKLQSNKVKDRNGRTIHTDTNTRFYLYVVCDILDNYKQKLERYKFVDTIDKLGMYRMDDHCYIEILTYDKIINDAKKRNKILFEKLGI